MLGNAPRSLWTKESKHWVTEQIFSTYGHINESWLQVRERVAKLPKNSGAVAKMAALDKELFLPSLLKQKDETLGWIKGGRLKTPTLLIWGYNDPSAVIAGGIDLFNLVASSVPRSQFHLLNKLGHYSYREHAKDFVRVVADFIQGGRDKFISRVGTED